MIEVVRKPLEYRARKKVNTLIILDVHARDLVEKFVQNAVFSANSFEWESQLRFYWDISIDDIEIRKCTGKFRLANLEMRCPLGGDVLFTGGQIPPSGASLPCASDTDTSTKVSMATWSSPL